MINVWETTQDLFHDGQDGREAELFRIDEWLEMKGDTQLCVLTWVVMGRFRADNAAISIKGPGRLYVWMIGNERAGRNKTYH